MEKEQINYYTYKENRKCRYSKCQTPIADQAHATREFCPRELLRDGTVKNCKDDYWTSIKKEANSVYKEMELYHRMTEERLAHLYELKLPQITIEILDSIGIELSKSLMQYSIAETSYFYFINYLVTLNIINKQFNISKHENELF